MKLSKEAMEYIEYVSKQTGATEQMIVESALGFVALITRIPLVDQKKIELLVEKYRKQAKDLKQN